MPAFLPIDIPIAIALLATLYGHTLVGLDSSVVTPVAGAVVFGLLTLRFLLSLVSRGTGPRTAARAAAAAAFVLTIAMTSFVTVVHWMDQAPLVRDLGVFILVCGGPILLLGQVQRRSLLFAIGIICVIFALSDTVFNVMTYKGWITPIAVTQRATNFGVIARFPGLSGNTLAAGLTAMIGCIFLAERVAFGSTPWKLASLAAIILIVGDLWLIDARRYFGAAIFSVIVLCVPLLRRRFPALMVAVGLGSVGLWFTFHSIDAEEILRTNLILQGWQDVQPHILLGDGLAYRYPTNDTGFQGLWAAGVVESGIVDYVRSFGIVCFSMFSLATVLALGASRMEVTAAPILVAAFFGEIPYSGFLTVFLGSITFFTALLIVIYEEEVPARREILQLFLRHSRSYT